MATRGATKRTAKRTTKRAPAKQATKTARKTVAKTAAKTAATKATAKRAPAKKAPAKKAVAKKAVAKKAAAKRTPVRKAAAKRGTSDAGRYTDPALRDRIKRRIVAGTKGGRAGQWSARKAQLLAHEYEAAGGGYRGGKSATQRHLDEWTAEEWTTRDGTAARRGKTTARYLPKKAWAELTPAERKATDDKKRAGARGG
ncbi:MAG TPA: hypothetical protein VEZ47_00500, partial [Gemmatirosa sp.]|nr:hypothetical protein [Gemmatirosa sp.]